MTTISRILAAGLLAVVGQAQAINFTIPYEEDGIKGVVNTSVTMGAAWRMSQRSQALVGKSNNDPGVCGIPYQSCQGSFRDQLYPAQRLSQVPGQYTLNADDGNLNYNKGDAVEAPLKITSDLTLTYDDFGFFGRALFFHDFVNDSFTENHPNQLTLGNYATAGYAANDPGFVLPFPGNKFGRVYGPGAQVNSKRTDTATRHQIGQNLQPLDSYIYGKVPIPLTDDKKLTFKLGRQTINWGESTLIVINSINQAQPVNANNFHRVGFAVEEVFTPINQLFLSFEPFESATVETFYQLEWKNVEADAPGSFLSTVDLGTNNAGGPAYASFGGAAEDPDGVASLQYNPLSRISNTTLRLGRVADLEPHTAGQFGVAFKYYAAELNSGTELGAYFMNYHSRLPYVSFFSAQASCARREGNQDGVDANSTTSLFTECRSRTPPTGGLPQLAGSPEAATTSVAALDSAKLMLEYPENIQLYGLSFNTTFGDYSLQGEVAYRPNLPLQVDQEDLAFAAFGPTLTRCHEASLNCSGASAVSLPGVTLPSGAVSTAGLDTNTTRPAGTPLTYADSSFLAGPNSTTGGYTDYINLLVGHVPGSARSFPNFIIPYRGGVVGENAPTDLSRPLDRNNPGYIRGFERFQVFQFDLGATRVLGATDNPLGADQILLVAEAGATWIPGLPALDQLQIEAPGTFANASAGADGSGSFFNDATRRQACSTNPSCSFGPDGLRFNPHQENLHQYTTSFSWATD